MFNIQDVIDDFQKDTESRLIAIKESLQMDVNRNDSISNMWKKLWRINKNNSTDFYSMFGKNIGCGFETLEGMEALSSFIHNLHDDANFNLVFKPDENDVKSQLETQIRLAKIISKKHPEKNVDTAIYPYVGDFEIEWCGMDASNIIYESEMLDFLDFY